MIGICSGVEAEQNERGDLLPRELAYLVRREQVAQLETRRRLLGEQAGHGCGRQAAQHPQRQEGRSHLARRC